MTRAAEKVASSPPRSAARAVPPEWGIERVIKGIGRGPAALGRGLDAAAKLPVIGGVVRFFSSVWLGIILLTLIGAYIAFGSGFAQVRASMEMTDLQFFDAVPMRILLACLALDLSIVTLRRIPLTLFKLGSWTVHIGILTLITGCVWYFGLKEEGSVRLFLNRPAEYSYDVAERALYAVPVNEDGSLDMAHPTITALPTLPFYYEHGTAGGKPLDITLNGVLPGTDAVVRIAGYYPAAEMRLHDYRAGTAGEAGEGPALLIGLKNARDTFGSGWLLGNSPAGRVIDGNLPVGIEYLYHPTAERMRDLQASFEGPVGILVRIPKLGIERTYAAKQGVAIAVEGSTYTLTPVEIGEIPLISKGYENAASTSLTVAVSRKDGEAAFQFERDCLFRYPERSPDWVNENGKRTRKQAGVDPDIQIIFLDAQLAQAWIVEGEDGKLTAITRGTDGKSVTQPMTEKGVALPVPESPGLQMAVTEQVANAAPVMEVTPIPAEQRPRSQTVSEVIHFSMIDVEVSRGSWVMPHLYVPFYQFAEVNGRGPFDKPVMVEVPGVDGKPGKKVALLMSTVRRKLPSTVTLTKFEPIKPPGATMTHSDFKSTMAAQSPGETVPRELVAQLNAPALDHGLYYFQAQWDGDDNAPADKRFSVIGVANRPGIPVMITGAILIAIGIGYAFYAKPLLLKAKKESLARWAKENKGGQTLERP